MPRCNFFIAVIVLVDNVFFSWAVVLFKLVISTIKFCAELLGFFLVIFLALGVKKTQYSVAYMNQAADFFILFIRQFLLFYFAVTDFENDLAFIDDFSVLADLAANYCKALRSDVLAEFNKLGLAVVFNAIDVLLSLLLLLLFLINSIDTVQRRINQSVALILSVNAGHNSVLAKPISLQLKLVAGNLFGMLP